MKPSRFALVLSSSDDLVLRQILVPELESCRFVSPILAVGVSMQELFEGSQFQAVIILFALAILSP